MYIYVHNFLVHAYVTCNMGINKTVAFVFVVKNMRKYSKIIGTLFLFQGITEKKRLQQVEQELTFLRNSNSVSLARFPIKLQQHNLCFRYHSATILRTIHALFGEMYTLEPEYFIFQDVQLKTHCHNSPPMIYQSSVFSSRAP